MKGLENSVISKAIKKHGEENFTFEILEICSIEDLHMREIYHIKKLKTYGCGYNVTTGGDGVRGVGKVLNLDRVSKIIVDLRASVPASKIANDFNVNVEMINRINNGNAWVIEGEIYPIRETLSVRIREDIDKDKLIETVATLGFKGAGLIYNLTDNGVKARLRMVGLPFLIKEVKELYGNNSEVHVEASLNGEILNIETAKELVDYILLNKLTEAGQSSVESSVRRLLNGKRKSYLGITARTKEKVS